MYFYWQKVDIGIELKFQTVGTDQTKPFFSDIERLLKLKNDIDHPEENSINTGIAILFFQRNSFLNNIRRDIFPGYEEVSKFELKSDCVNAYLATPEKIFYRIYK